VTDDLLTAALAEKVFGWKSSPDRFIRPGRSWLPRWRFAPFVNIDDAYALLDSAKPTESVVVTDSLGQITAQVRIGNRMGSAAGSTRAAVITCAIARALGLDIDSEGTDGQS